ncbi:MAG: acyltransferase [Rickettsiales bacterium]|nr:acyltransferase [Rickettsiales bacterium]
MSLESSAVARTYFPHVNLLRAFAALSVLVYHVIEHYSWETFPIGYGLVWFKVGWMSVDLFFVISGFVIAWSLIQLHTRHTQFKPLAREFLWRRAGRIVPLYLVTLLVYAIAVQPTLFNSYVWVHWLTHFTFTHPFLPHTFGSINGINWSVGIEVHFYLFALITSPWWVRRKAVSLFLAGVVAAWSLRGIAWVVAEKFGLSGSQLFGVMVQMPMMLDEFAAGAALALLLHHYPLEKWPGTMRQQGLVLLAVLVAVMIVAFQTYWMDAGYWHNPTMVIFWRSLIALAFTLLLAFFIWLPPLPKPNLLYRAFSYLGDISYGIYLWHLTVILLLKPYLEANLALSLWVIIPCVLVLSAMSWHLLEKPMIKWSKARSLTSRNVS